MMTGCFEGNRLGFDDGCEEGKETGWKLGFVVGKFFG
jgi:hypothetical protein